MQKLASPRGIAPLINKVRDLILSARHTAAAAVDTLHVQTNFEIGRLIVEQEQRGSQRAEYGREVLAALAKRLTAEFGAGFSLTNLKIIRKFFLVYGNGSDRIGQTPSDQSSVPQKVRKFALSWSHYVALLTISDTQERSFYEIEASTSAWSLSELKRQLGSGLYERLALSRNKKRIKELASKGQRLARPEDMLKSPYVLEFLGMDERPEYSESELEAAIIGKLQHFLLELGKGFLFEARQKRFTIDEDHFYVDLVFYNRLLRCYVLIDLKIDKLTHQDLGQMQMYVNYFDRHVKRPDEKPTIGIVLCRRKRDALVEITLPRGANIFASEYRLYLPSKEELKERLVEWLE